MSFRIVNKTYRMQIITAKLGQPTEKMHLLRQTNNGNFSFMFTDVGY